MAREVQSGVFQSRSIRFGLADGVVGVAWNEALLEKADLPEGLREGADGLAARISAGELEVPSGF